MLLSISAVEIKEKNEPFFIIAYIGTTAIRRLSFSVHANEIKVLNYEEYKIQAHSVTK